MTESSGGDVIVIGGGPAGLMAAETLAQAGVAVTIYDAMPSLGRKFLMAGRGGLNLTHSEPLPAFLARYGAATPHLQPAIEAFAPDALRAWSDGLAQPTFIGSSGRVFPEAFKASPLLRAWLLRLDGLGVRLALRQRWIGWDDQGQMVFTTPDGVRSVRARAVVLALGGASYPRLGSGGAWTELLRAKSVAVSNLRPANCGFSVAWSDVFADRFEGHPLKSVALSFDGRSVRGEAMITRAGIEGGGIYALSSGLRDAVIADGKAVLHVALRPELDTPALIAKLAVPRGKQSLTSFLRKALHLSPVAIGLLQEASLAQGRRLAVMSIDDIAALINAVPIALSGVAPIARAISSAGGVAFDELDSHAMLKQLPGVFIAGEMLDWEAPTGGYLLQACFATGVAAGRGVLNFLGR